MVQIFEVNSFMQALETTYSDPLNAEPDWLCLLNLVFAIGLMMAITKPGTKEAAIIDKLRSEHLDRAEVFYLNAKSLNDPMTGLEDADFWSVQALLLMTVYMLAKSKRNTAFALLGMAIRSAYALGLHREETMIIFNTDEQAARRNVWKSLFVMDRFLSCSLGRPPGISEDDCSGDALRPPEPTTSTEDPAFNQQFHGNASMAQTSQYGLDAAVRSCSVIGTILKRVYQQRKISTRLAQEIADICKVWSKALAPVLHWRQAPAASPSQGVAILHVNLLYCHSIALLTRPFFLFILNDVLQQQQQQQQQLPFSGARTRRNYSRMEKFSEACVIASTHSVILVQNALEAGHLPRRNPFAIYFLFAAALIILSNEYAMLYRNDLAEQCIRNSMNMMAYCAETDPQASRLLYILSTFRAVVLEQITKRTAQQQQAIQLPPFNLKPNTNPYSSTGPSISPHTMASTSLPPLPQSIMTLPPVSAHSTFLSNSQPPSKSTLSSAPHPQPLPTSLPSLISPTATSSSTTTTSQPIEPSLASPAPANPLAASSAPQTPRVTSLDRELSFSNIFDFSALGGPDRLSVSEESSGPDEHIDFDTLWAWPNNTPAVGTPRAGLDTTQGVIDSAVPLFGVVDR
jgi:hypothetical protein